MQQDLRELGLQDPAGWWDGGAETAGEGSSELVWVCAHVAGHCQQVQHPDILLFTKSHPVLVVLVLFRVKQSRALGPQRCRSSWCSLCATGALPALSALVGSAHRIGPHDLGR